MARRRLAGLVLAVAVGGFLSAASAHGEHVPGATYTGTHSGGGTVSFTLQGDGNYVIAFNYTYLPIGCGTSLSDNTTEGAPVVNDTFYRPVLEGGQITYTGTFTDPQHATGTLSWTGPYCQSERPTVTWEASTPSPPLADLSVAVSDEPDPVLVGEDMTYTVAVDNAGPMSAPGTTLTQTLPAGVTFAAAETTQGSCSHAQDTVTCNLGVVPRGGHATVTVDVVPTQAGRLTSSATVSEARQDPNQANDSASQETTVQAPCIVPNVKGKPLAAARQALARASCATGKVTRKYSKKVKKGRVLSQAPAPRTRLGHLAPVSLVVSRGKKRA